MVLDGGKNSQESEKIAVDEENTHEDLRLLKENRALMLSNAKEAALQLKESIQNGLLEISIQPEVHNVFKESGNYKGFDELKTAISDATEIMESSQDKSEARLDIFNKVVDPLRENINRVLRTTDQISSSLDAAKKYNKAITDSAEQIDVSIDDIDELTSIEKATTEIGVLLDELEIFADKQVAKEQGHDAKALAKENEKAKEAGW